MPTPNKILLHTCCGPCASGCIARLEADGLRPVLFFANSNIDTAEEFGRRLAAAQKLAAAMNLELIVDEYRHDLWLDAVSGFEDEPERGERCRRCFAFSFASAAADADASGTEFTTSLTVSPHKDAGVISEAGRVHRNFRFFDFKKGGCFSLSLTESSRLGLYRQNYCGCEFSRRGREQ